MVAAAPSPQLFKDPECGILDLPHGSPALYTMSRPSAVLGYFSNAGSIQQPYRAIKTSDTTFQLHIFKALRQK